MTPTGPLDRLLDEVRACRHCAGRLPLGPRPVLRARSTARLLIVGQAPGLRVHESGIPWHDASGDRLRTWLAVGRKQFYDDRHIAIVPIGFCYPGSHPNGGDAPPAKECAPLWHPRLRAELGQIELTLLVGSYAQAFYLHGRRRRTLTETVNAWNDYLPDHFPLPHPSWRNTHWLRRNPWFEETVLPELRARVHALLPPA